MGSVTSRSVLVLLVLLLTGAAPGRATASGVADDTVVVVVSAENPVTEISRLQLADLYLGRASRFPDGRRAIPIDQRPGAPARGPFYEEFIGRSLSEVKAHWSKLVFTGRGRPPRDVPGGEEMKARVAGDPRAIGYLDHRLVDGTLRVVQVE